MLHNNPSAIACREGSTLWNCSAAENLLISVGCGDLQVDCGGKHSFSRLWNAFSHKLSPAKEEEIRALWGADTSRHYERLDPRLSMPDVPLDSLHTMLDALPAARASMASCQAFKNQIQKASWRLVAATFYAQVVTVKRLGARRVVSLRLASRLGSDVERIWRKWPDAYFRIGKRDIRSFQIDGDHSLRMSCLSAEHELDLTFNVKDKSASISGFPLPLAPIEENNLENRKSVLGKRKRGSFP